MPSRRPAAAIDPVSLMPSSRSALPGPIAMSGSSTMRRRAPTVRLPILIRPPQHGPAATPSDNGAKALGGGVDPRPAVSVASGRERDGGAVDQESAVAGIDGHGVALADPALEDHPGERVLQAALDGSLQRPRPVDRVVAGVREPAL